jgi:hypothetical protein
MATIGYARYGDTRESAQRLRAEGCTTIIIDDCGGLLNEGQGLLDAIMAAGHSGTLVVASVEDLTGHYDQYADLAKTFGRFSITLRCLDSGVDNVTATGQHTLRKAASWAEYLATTTAGEEVYREAGTVLKEQWEPRLAAAEKQIASAVNVPRLQAEIAALDDLAGTIDTYEYLRRVIPLNQKLWSVRPDLRPDPAEWERVRARAMAGESPESA